MDFLKTNDGYDIKIGMWLSDENGTYEVRDITSDEVVLQEILFSDNWDEDANPTDWRYGYYLDLTHEEASELSYL